MSSECELDPKEVIANLKKKKKRAEVLDSVSSAFKSHLRHLQMYLPPDEFGFAAQDVHSLELLVMSLCDETVKLSKLNNSKKISIDEMEFRIKELSQEIDEKDLQLDDAKAILDEYSVHLEKGSNSREKSEIDRLCKENAALAREVEALRVEGAETLATVTELMNEKEEFEERIAEADEKVDKMRRRLDDANALLEETRGNAQEALCLLEAQHKTELSNLVAKVDFMEAQLSMGETCEATETSVSGTASTSSTCTGSKQSATVSPRSVTQYLPSFFQKLTIGQDHEQSRRNSAMEEDEDVIKMHADNLHAANLEMIAQLTEKIQLLENSSQPQSIREIVHFEDDTHSLESTERNDNIIVVGDRLEL